MRRHCWLHLGCLWLVAAAAGSDSTVLRAFTQDKDYKALNDIATMTKGRTFARHKLHDSSLSSDDE
ncbi:unnamed protein product [Leptidea sinapis]|uniref:RxLR effector protein n=1 Tax=Leptidea sinapis TaxID=189913 RepID=A0A5E4PWU0_9NEOP|nr:unnamed protein product [Leptidea sinapis]